MGVGLLIQHPRRFDTYWVHLLWVAKTFLYILGFWWFQYGYRDVGEWTFGLYLFVVGYAILLYLMAVVLLPDELSEHVGFREYFYDRRRWFFGLLAASQIVDIADTLAKGDAHAATIGAGYWVLAVVYVGLALVAAFWSSARFHAIFVIVNLAISIWALRELTIA